MGRVVKKLKLPKTNQEEEELKPPIEVSSDDEEANEDLSLKIVEKARLQACSNDVVVNGGGAGVVVNVTTSVEPQAVKRQKKKTTEAVGVAKIEEEEETSESPEVETLTETDPAEKPDNVVLRKLLRGPRYFDPPDDNSWGACYNCGEEGHTTANCTSARRKKPCFVCGSFEHNAKQCNKGKDCFICKKEGHRARDCPERNIGGTQNAKMCLKCGDSGHDMLSCRNNYSPDDLEDIQCYVCKCFGHLCCVNTSAGSREISCYRCGQSGHSGLACTRLRAESYGMETRRLCYKCGEKGHFVRDCTNSSSVKTAKKNPEFSNYKGSRSEDKKKHKEVKSAPPNDQDKVRKRKKAPYEGVTSAPRAKKRGGWITEDPGDVSQRKYEPNNSMNSPITPANRAIWVPSYGSADGYASSSHSYNSGRRLYYGTPPSNGSAQHYHNHQLFANSPLNGPPQYYQHRHRFSASASRFNNSSTGLYWPNNSNNL